MNLEQPVAADVSALDRRLSELASRLVRDTLGEHACCAGQPMWISPAAIIREMRPYLGWN